MRAEEKRREQREQEKVRKLSAETSMSARRSPLLDVIGACIVRLRMLLNDAPVVRVGSIMHDG